jgi:hypothetical protein
MNSLSVQPLSIREVGYDHPDAQRLIAEVQAEYVWRYGGPDSSPVDPAQFRPPQGLFAGGVPRRRAGDDGRLAPP